MSSRTRDDDRTVYVGNLPGEKVTDEELIDFFKPFGKISGETIERRDEKQRLCL